ncbi:hypothetical protein ARMGADRAFT_1170601 [Armillaria gallica]|uniref:Uncharacterized protein n=1 Tax=Armillaria gallica TaxID=47427 RepID=A0A2H3D2K9_ARMGA|nr:hypothetical protein ARMGADRAFT_1170601 [Armillaria gallica]
MAILSTSCKGWWPTLTPDRPSMQEYVVEAICLMNPRIIVNGEMIFDIIDRCINAIISGIFAKITLVLDCCHGGMMVDIQNCRSEKEKSGEHVLWGRGYKFRIFLVPCKGYQMALEGFAESSAKMHPAFTQALILPLESDAERNITYEQLMGRIGALPSQTLVIHGDEYMSGSLVDLTGSSLGSFPIKALEQSRAGSSDLRSEEPIPPLLFHFYFASTIETCCSLSPPLNDLPATENLS